MSVRLHEKQGPDDKPLLFLGWNKVVGAGEIESWTPSEPVPICPVSEKGNCSREKCAGVAVTWGGLVDEYGADGATVFVSGRGFPDGGHEGVKSGNEV